ncbi:MAG TPA: PHP domain-containing protein [Clostridia bacterium]|jgi:hypothetical protein|nr:PHP domain-containing protein [Clostridia bacterium]HPZ52790.1 PHP domain-containing protein [Clostridia bacterium]
MRKYLLPKDGIFYKANLHCHSTHSDGKLTVEQLKEVYKKEGYSVVAFSDHNVLIPHMDLCDEEFLPITSIEIDVSDNTVPWPKNATYHINFFSKDPYADKFIELERIYNADVINDIIRRAKERGFIAQYNHPRWSLQTACDFLPLEGLFAFEVYNTGCEVDMMNGWGEYEYETYVMSGKRCGCVATDDNHNSQELKSPKSDSFKGFTMIKAKELSYDSVMNALEDLDFYASTGPVIHELYVEDNTVYIETSPCSCILLRTDSRISKSTREESDVLTKHAFSLDFNYEYIRFECSDIFGNKALTRAYFKDEIQ